MAAPAVTSRDGETRLRILCATAALVALPVFPLPPATPDMGERIEVTGSNIRRVDREGPAPLVVFKREEIDRNAGQNLQDLLVGLPMSNVGSFVESNASGIAGASLRGLGTNATLILLNGRRLPVHGFAQTAGPTGIAFVNLNSIPLSLIERIEVLKDGASAIYGSDAIGGVINIILRRDFRGAELFGSIGQSSRHDTDDVRGTISLGIGDLSRDGYNVMGSFDYYHRDPLKGADRERSSTADQRRNGGRDLRSDRGQPGTWLTRPAGLEANTPFPDCPAESLDNALATTNACAFNQNPTIAMFPRTNRKAAFGRAVRAFSTDVSAFVEAYWNENRSALGAQALADSFVLPVGHNSNPHPFAVQTLYRWIDLGERYARPNTVTTRLTAGLEGLFRGFHWDFAYDRSLSDNRVTHDNQLSIADRNALVAGNVYSFLHPETNDPALIDSVRGETWRSRYSKIETWLARASGPAVSLPSGALGLAIGLEHRKDTLSGDRESRWASGALLGLTPDSHEAGTRTVTAVFGELAIPVLAAVEAQLAVRHERYSDYGSSTAPKAALAWRPASHLLVRAAYDQGFRAPSFVQLYTDLLVQNLSVIDEPRCAGYRTAFGTLDRRTVAACANSETRVGNGGNPGLGAEESRGESLGMVLEPVAGASLTVDWYRIRHDNRIAAPSTSAILQNEDLFPGAVVRDPRTADDLVAGTRGPLVRAADLQRRIGIYQYYRNVATAKTQGIDVELRLRIGLGGYGSVRFESMNTYIRYLTVKAAAGQPEVDQLSGESRAPRYRGTHSVIWQRERWDASLVTNVVGSSAQPNLVNGVRPDVASWTTLDAQVGYAGLRSWTFSLGVRNALDREPPFYNGEVLGYDTATHSLVGRFYYARAKWRFG